MGSEISPLAVRGLTKTFDGSVVVDDVDFDLHNDEVVALVGPSGCGKSTLLRMIAGLIRADTGTIRLAGKLVEDGHNSLTPERRSVGLVFQEHNLFPHLRVGANVAFGLSNLSAQQKTARVDEMLAMVDLVGFEQRYPHELSGGERQRVGLARALAPEPEVILLDEPFTSLDQNLRVELRQQVISMLAKGNTSAVFVTHDQREALTVGDRIAVMQHGKLVQVGTPAEVFHQPVSEFVGAFMGEASFLSIIKDTYGASSVLGEVDLGGRASEEFRAMVRPDDVRFVSDPTGSACITNAEYLGTSWLVTARSYDGSSIRFFSSHLTTPTLGERGMLELVPGHNQVVVRVD